MDVPKNISARGSCGNDSQALNLTWSGNELIIVFEKNITDNRFRVKNINFSFTPTEETFPSIKGKLKLLFTKAVNMIIFRY